MKYLFKTKLGVSKDSYTHSEAFPLYGSSQGAGNLPAIWHVISYVLLNLYEEGAHSAMLMSPDGLATAKVFMISFINDISGRINDFILPEAQPLQHYITKEFFIQEKNIDNLVSSHSTVNVGMTYLAPSGRSLQDAKSSYHYLYYSFTSSGLSILRGGCLNL